MSDITVGSVTFSGGTCGLPERPQPIEYVRFVDLEHAKMDAREAYIQRLEACIAELAAEVAALKEKNHAQA